MLSVPAPHRLAVERLSRSARAVEPDIDWTTPIDRSRRFYCEALTPLAYTRVYRELDEAHRLRYNQLTGIYSNELIGFLETFLLRRTLDALAGRRDLALPAALRSALHAFRAEEARHADLWKRLNRLSEPAWYADRDRRILCLPAAVLTAASVVASHPVACPLVFWIQLSQEERSIAISRAFARTVPGEIEPRYAAVYVAHLRDEVRHVQIDWHLIEHFFAGRPAAIRRLHAWAFRRLVGALFLVPAGSTARIVHLLVTECPELRPLAGRMLRELRALRHDDTYQSMMYSREATPITFALFDRFPEFHAMSRCLTAYRPRPTGARP